MNKNKVRWKRSVSGSLIVYVYEETEKGIWEWRSYTASKCYTPDNLLPNGSAGLDTFRACIKNGYTILDMEGNEIE